MNTLFFLPFILIPLVFSHIGAYIGYIARIPSSYERIKVELFIALTLALILFYGKDIYRWLKTQNIYFSFWALILGTFLTLGITSNNIPINADWIGSNEKNHGLLFFLTCIGWSALLFSVKKYHSFGYIPRIIRTMGWLLALIWIGQYMGLDPLAAYYTGNTWWSDRVFATLGNPNYLAGYLIMTLPFLFHGKNQKEHILPWIIIILGILATGSFIGIGIAILYLLIKLFWKQRIFLGTGFVLLWFILMGLQYTYTLIPNEKLLSLETRWIIMQQVGKSLLEEPRILVTGQWNDSMGAYYDTIINRSEALRKYIDDNATLDSSHNILLDSIFFLGFPLTLWWILGLIFLFPRLERQKKEGILLFFAFFCFNIPVVSHFVLLGYFLVPKDR